MSRIKRKKIVGWLRNDNSLFNKLPFFTLYLLYKVGFIFSKLVEFFISMSRSSRYFRKYQQMFVVFVFIIICCSKGRGGGESWPQKLYRFGILYFRTWFKFNLSEIVLLRRNNRSKFIFIYISNRFLIEYYLEKLFSSLTN